MSKSSTLIVRVDAGLKKRLEERAGKRGMSAFVIAAIEARLGGKQDTWADEFGARMRAATHDLLDQKQAPGNGKPSRADYKSDVAYYAAMNAWQREA